jgi:hypothetical protein
VEYRSKNEQVLLRYLLGELSENEQEQIEQSYFTDEALFEHLGVVEDELIDNYVRNGLSTLQREQFEKNFLCSPERHGRVELAEILQEFAARNSTRRIASSLEKNPARPALAKLASSWLPMAAMVLLAIGSGLLLIDRSRLKSDLDSARNQREELEKEKIALQQQAAERDARNQALALELERANDIAPREKSDRTSSTSVVAILLTSGFSRGGADSQTLSISPSVQIVRLKLAVFEDGQKRYKVFVKDVDGREVWNVTGLKALTSREGRTVELKLPAKKLAEKDYIVTLKEVASTGAEYTVAEYPLRVLRR